MQRSTAGGTAGLALAVLASLSLAGCATTADQEPKTPCDSRPEKTVKLKIKLKADGAPEKVQKYKGNGRDEDDDRNYEDGDVIRVCPGDFVVWKLKTASFALRFVDTSTGKVPFEWPSGSKNGAKVKSNEWRLIDVVREDVDRGRDLKYVVTIPGKPPLDPIIIVEP